MVAVNTKTLLLISIILILFTAINISINMYIRSNALYIPEPSYILPRDLTPRLSQLVIDADKDWEGHRITNISSPTSPGDASTKEYVDLSVLNAGLDLYLLAQNDTDIPQYLAMSFGVPNQTEAYVDVTSNSIGDKLVGAWIAPSELKLLKLGTYTLYMQAERVSGNIKVRLFYRMYDRLPNGTEVLIGESAKGDLVKARANLYLTISLPNDYVLNGRLVVKVYASYEKSGSPTTIRIYIQGKVNSRLSAPASRELLDNIYVAYDNALKDILPYNDTAINIGSPTKRINNIYTLNITTGDLVFSNGWRIVEDEQYGIVLVAPNGTKYALQLVKVDG